MRGHADSSLLILYQITRPLQYEFPKFFLLSQAHVLRDNVAVLSTAFLAVAPVYTIHFRETHAIELFLVLTIALWSSSTGVRS